MTAIFNPQLRKVRRERAKRRVERGGHDAYLLRRCGEQAAEKIQDVNRQFKSAVLIGLPVFAASLLENLPKDKHPVKIHQYDDWPEVFPKGCDLVVSGLVLQSLNPIAEALSAAGKAMEPDGLLLASIVGGESLLALRRACFGADLEKLSGALPRVAPMIALQSAAALLGQAGFAQPVIERDNFTVNYKRLETMIGDIRDIGETNSLAAYKGHYPGREFAQRLKNHYPERDDQDRFVCDFEILWIAGWVPHASQQKPLKPGSAKTKLSDVLKKIRDE